MDEYSSIVQFLTIPWVSLVLGYLGVILHIMTKPQGERLLDIWGWIKGHPKTIIVTCITWLAIWFLWMGQALNWLLPSEPGPVAILIGWTANSFWGHVTDQYQARIERKRILD